MENLPLYIILTFIVVTILAIGIFYKATKRSTAFLIVVFAWLFVQTIVSLRGFYTSTTSIPPRFILLIGPPVLFIIFLFLTKPGKRFIDGLDLKTLTIFHIIRIPVELVLFWLFVKGTVPSLMTFEGWNFDILSGISAPLIVLAVFGRKIIRRKLLLAWNFICLGLLINIVLIAVLSGPFAFQQFAFSQPNIALLYFPFTWLPCIVVPLALFSHLAAIRQLVKSKELNAVVS